MHEKTNQQPRTTVHMLESNNQNILNSDSDILSFLVQPAYFLSGVWGKGGGGDEETDENLFKHVNRLCMGGWVMIIKGFTVTEKHSPSATLHKELNDKDHSVYNISLMCVCVCV